MVEEDNNDRLETIKVVAEARALRQMRKIQEKERLRNLLLVARCGSVIDAEILRLHEYLYEWAHHQADYRLTNGARGESCLAKYMKSSSPTMSELLDKSNGWAMSVVDSSIDDLVELQDGMLMRSALRVRWLNEGVSRDAGVRVRAFRSGRMQSMSMMQVDALADRAELALVPIVKRKGLPL